VPALGFGTYELHGAHCRDMVAAALELGIRHLDTAQSYGNEAAVGEALATAPVARSDVFLTTTVADDRHAPAALLASVEESLDRLETDHVDLLLLHWPVDWDIVDASLDAMSEVRDRCWARHLGVSNFTASQLDRVRGRAPLEVLQVECHPFFQQSDLRRWCVAADWVFTAYTPLAKGMVAADETLCDIAAAHGSTPAAVALAWLLSLDHVTAIPRTGSVDHLVADLAGLDLELSASDLDRITALDAGRRLVDPPHAPW
jgi:2,5-diketo-D-gluconate reductase B